MKLTRFAYLTDLHYGFEQHNGRLQPLHDMKAFKCALNFLKDFQPHVIILGGDILDCAVISHHNHGKPGRVENMRLESDAAGCRREIIKPLEALGADRLIYMVGNHEDWLKDLTDAQPSLKGLVDLDHLLQLDEWEVLPQGAKFNLGKLWFMHGDTLAGGVGASKKAVIDGGRSVRFGHYHTFSAFTKVSFLDEKCGHTGVAVPCLCSRSPKYGEGKGNSWVQGFLSGFVFADGSFNDYVTIITDGRCIGPNGEVYTA